VRVRVADTGHAARIEVQSAPLQGAAFSFALPAAQPELRTR